MNIVLSKKRNITVILILLLILVIIFMFHYILHYYNVIKFDDAYITFRYAKNLSNFGQLSYNLGEKVFGTTTPLWAILLGLSNKLSLNIEHFSVYFSIILLFFTLFIIIIKFQNSNKKFFFLFFLIFLLNPNVLKILFSGMEIYFCIFLISFAFFFIKKNEIKIIFSLLILNARIDMGILYIISIFLYLYFIEYFWGKIINLKYLIRCCILLLAVIVLYFGINIIIFNQLIPNTIIAKSVIYKGTEYEQSFLYRICSTIKMSWGGYTALFLWLSYFISLFFFLKRSKLKHILILDFFILLNVILLIFFITRHQSWYYITLMFFFITTIVLHFLFSNIKFIINRKIVKNTLIVFLTFFSFYQFRYYYQHKFKNRQILVNSDLYKVAKIIKHDSTVFCGDIGIIGYFTKNCYIYDYAGLITPSAIEYNKKKKKYANNLINVSTESLLDEIKTVNPVYINLRKSYIFTEYIVKYLVQLNLYKVIFNSSEILLKKY